MILDKRKTKEIEEIAVKNGVEHIELMTRAGTAAAKFAAEQYGADRKSVAVVCGRGHNGGDGFVAARALAKSGAKVRVLLTHGYPTEGDDIDLFGRAERAGIKCLLFNVEEDREEFFKTINIADIIIDAVCGTGFSGELDENLKKIFACINAARAKVIAIDLPSGVYADTGCVAEGAVKADATVTFTTRKPCHVIYPALEHCGKVYTADIGIDVKSIPVSDAALEITDFQSSRLCFNPRRNNTHKGDYGTLLAICGSESMPGAAVLAIKAAVRCGAGLIRCVVPEKCMGIVASNVPEATYLPIESDCSLLSESDRTQIIEALKKSTACLVGCGMGQSRRTAEILKTVLENAEIPLLLDADALNCLAEQPELLKNRKSEIIITPHPGEMARLTGKSASDVQSSRLETACCFGRDYGVTVVLKGANTIISMADGRLFVNTTGNPGMAKGGSGDVLAGIISSLLAQRMYLADAVSCGVYIHGECGDRSAKKYSVTAMTPSDIIEMIPSLFTELER